MKGGLTGAIWRSDEKVFFRGEVAHEAVSRRPPISLYTIVTRTEGYTYAAKVWDLSTIFAPCQTFALRFATFSPLYVLLLLAWGEG